MSEVNYGRSPDSTNVFFMISSSGFSSRTGFFFFFFEFTHPLFFYFFFKCKPPLYFILICPFDRFGCTFPILSTHFTKRSKNIFPRTIQFSCTHIAFRFFYGTHFAAQVFHAIDSPFCVQTHSGGRRGDQAKKTPVWLQGFVPQPVPGKRFEARPACGGSGLASGCGKQSHEAGIFLWILSDCLDQRKRKRQGSMSTRWPVLIWFGGHILSGAGVLEVYLIAVGSSRQNYTSMHDESHRRLIQSQIILALLLLLFPGRLDAERPNRK